jgi:hypothetical protein
MIIILKACIIAVYVLSFYTLLGLIIAFCRGVFYFCSREVCLKEEEEEDTIMGSVKEYSKKDYIEDIVMAGLLWPLFLLYCLGVFFSYIFKPVLRYIYITIPMKIKNKFFI